MKALSLRAKTAVRKVGRGEEDAHLSEASVHGAGSNCARAALENRGSPNTINLRRAVSGPMKVCRTSSARNSPSLMLIQHVHNKLLLLLLEHRSRLDERQLQLARSLHIKSFHLPSQYLPPPPRQDLLKVFRPQSAELAPWGEV